MSDRDFVLEFTSAAAILMVHLSRMCEELVLWCSPLFGFVRLPDAFCTGSSIMPQKKNPDVPELVRGKTGRVVGSLVGLLTLMKAQPLAYNRDNQEDKESLFDAADTVRGCLAVFTEMIGGLEADREALRAAAGRGHATATDLADYLVRAGMAFRDAHEAVGAGGARGPSRPGASSWSWMSRSFARSAATRSVPMSATCSPSTDRWRRGRIRAAPLPSGSGRR